MSTPDWKELQQLWQDSPAAEPAKQIIGRQQRRRWLRIAYLVSEVVSVIIAVAMAVWIFSHRNLFALVMGVGLLLFTGAAVAGSFWARLLPPEADHGSIASALDVAIRRARISVRLGLASLWVVAAALLSFALSAFAIALLREVGPGKARSMLLLFGCEFILIALCQGLSIVYYQHRSRELARLEEIKRSLAGS
jgi:hypothetical protein